MLVNRPSLQEFALQQKLLTAKELEQVNEFARKEKVSFEEALRLRAKWKEKEVSQLLADYWEVPPVNLSSQKIQQETLQLLPPLLARTQKVIPFRKDQKGIHVAMANPSNLEVRRQLEKKFDENVLFYYTPASEMEDVLRLYDTTLSQALDEIIAQDISKLHSVDEDNIELPIIRITDAILSYAASNNASDIHIEPLENYVQVRYRIDGMLHDVVQLPKLILGPVVTRIKILSKLRIDEHFSAQDGRFDYVFQDNKVDARVSIVPITEGEKVVIRLFTDRSRRLSLEDLGMSEKDLRTLRAALKKPYGMILSSGPTGSGKTTTMYAIMQMVNSREINISTIEDPVEYDLPGVNQIQVNERTNLTFARGLRSILRQDPDIIMVGEIRDEDAAGIAVNAAMTGHLVLSTLHANNAATTIPRLLDLKIKPFLLASSLNLIISQRLVRRICARCKVTLRLDKQTLAQLDAQLPSTDLQAHVRHKNLKFFKGDGCTVCAQTGYLGRIGIYEMYEVDEDMRELIMAGASAKEIEDAAVKKGMTTMLQDGLQKVANGVTTIEEIVRVMSI